MHNDAEDRLRRLFISEPKATSPVTARYATFAIGRGQEQPRPRRETVSVLTGERQSRSIGPFWVRLARHCPDSRFDRFVSSSRRRRDDRAYLQNHETPAPDAQHACDRRVGNVSVDVGNLCDSASRILPNLLYRRSARLAFGQSTQPKIASDKQDHNDNANNGEDIHRATPNGLTTVVDRQT